MEKHEKEYMMSEFDYAIAFSRNLGWVTEDEQLILKGKKVAIAGLGGVGGSHLITLARLGVSYFSIADMDVFDWPNLNRQAGAFASTMNTPKLDVMRKMLKDINPEASATCFSEGVTDDNIDAFLEGVDLYVDSLDVFCMDIRRKVFAKCREKGIPAISAAPTGMGTAVVIFSKNGMSYDSYFDYKEEDTFETQVIKFIVGLSPSMLQKRYLVREGTFDVSLRKAPSTPMGIDLAAGVACTNALKILLGRGQVIYAPCGMHFDAYLNRIEKTWIPFGNKNPLQKLKICFVKFILARQKRARG
ncbi:MAG: ThiF family adenylyltransferase [Pseudobdellovibrionaceae bacterium]|nr:ThiF family adenylyltransferase [Pseudobdellovibrionaceae bacterium]